jgi:hypothetical protein
MTKPGAYKQMGLNVKNFHIFLNKWPAECTKQLKYIFYNLYKKFKVPKDTVPYVFMHVEMNENAFDIKL